MNSFKILLLVILITSCSEQKVEKQIALYQTHCASCHVAPAIEQLPKYIWATKILPDMGARMGMKDSLYNPMGKLSYEEMEATIKTGIYPLKPRLSQKDWTLLKEYIISMAPDSLPNIQNKRTSAEIKRFTSKGISLDNKRGSFITFLEYNKRNQNVLIGDISGDLMEYNYKLEQNNLLKTYNSAVVAHTESKNDNYTTTIGQLNPSELSLGTILNSTNNTINATSELLHRPVNTLVTDLDKDGTDELVVSEFGNLTGRLSLFIKKDSLNYEKRILLNQPGTIRVLSKDMDNDGREDLIALTSQGDETITILYQQKDLSFIPEKVLRFSPVFGTSWFELIDYDGDGDDDIITVNGDNADKSYVHKQYHGMRIHINDGNNNFEEKYFYSLHGATRIVARDFDQDDDIDFGILSTFPDYKKHPEFSFVYLENIDKNKFSFNPYTLKEAQTGRWFLMDAGDLDNDGDDDIILSSFTYAFTPVPKNISKIWDKENIDIMVLENNLKEQ